MPVLYNKIPEAYVTLSCINTDNTFKMTDLRIVNIGKNHVVYQVESRNNKFGKERTSKIVNDKKRGKYFIHKNQKIFFKDFKYTL